MEVFTDVIFIRVRLTPWTHYYGMHMTHPGCTLPNKSLIMLTHLRKDCSK